MDYITPNPKFSVPNISDKFGNVLRTKNVNFDIQGYAQLSSRMARLYSDSSDNDYNIPMAIGRQAEGDFQVLTGESNYGTALGVTALTVSEDTGTGAPGATLDSDGCWFQGLWHASTDTKVYSRPATGGASETWTSRITGLTSGVRHILKVHKGRVQICVSNKNVVKQYDTLYSGTVDLTIPADYEISGMAYNSGNMGIITRLANDGTKGQDQEAMFFLWNGSTTGPNATVGLGSDAGIMIIPYKSSFAVLTRDGELKFYNGSGFQTIATFPFFFTKHVYGDVLSNNGLGSVFATIDGDNILIHIGNMLNIVSRTKEKYLKEFPAGIWCYDPAIGLYHKYSPSNSQVYIYTVTSGNVNTSTDVLTITSGTIPATGNVARMVSAAGIGGLTLEEDYYIIKTGAKTFQLASTREEAIAGKYIDITSATTGNNYFIVLDHKDYGTSRYDYPGAVKLVGDTYNNYAVYSDIITGGRIYNTDCSSINILCVGLPWMENIGYIETPKYFSEKNESGSHMFRVRFRPLNDKSSITIYRRTHDVYGLPISTCNDHATWTGEKVLYTTKDLTDAETYINAGGSLILEVLDGSGSGNIVEVQSVTCEGGTCSVELKTSVFGVSASDRCDFQLLNYIKEFTATSDDNDDGYIDFTVDAEASKFSQFLIVMQGDDIFIEDIYYRNQPK